LEAGGARLQNDIYGGPEGHSDAEHLAASECDVEHFSASEASALAAEFVHTIIQLAMIAYQLCIKVI